MIDREQNAGRTAVVALESLPAGRGRRACVALAALLSLAMTGCGSRAPDTDVTAGGAVAAKCENPDPGLSLAPGFCATVFAEGLGRPRHLAVAQDGTVYANTAPGPADEAANPAGPLIALRDTDSDGRADAIRRFGALARDAGGTGIQLYKGFLYAEDAGRIIRYPLSDAAAGVPQSAPEIVLSNLPRTGDHTSHTIAIRSDGALFVNSGSATNACQQRNRQQGSRGEIPCAEKATRGGIWRYDADTLGQSFSARGRYASGIRNAVGMALDRRGTLFATQHGRDQLAANWPRLYTDAQSQELPAEELLEVREGDDFGWPECYFDGAQGKLVLAPEYGGDGGKSAGLCASRKAPLAAFPAHWAPNALLIYDGDKFPAGYRGGAFIAFHGSWNRAPGPQGGFNIVFQPMRDGRVSGQYVVFADGFAGAGKARGEAAHRPTGLALGPDGALYVSDDAGGRVWRITYIGNGSDQVANASAVQTSQRSTQGGGLKHLPRPVGITSEQMALGRQIFHGEARGGTCSGCHGSEGRGSAMGPALNHGKWLSGDGSLEALARIITEGVAKPKRYPAPMPPKGGTELTDEDVEAVAGYVWGIGQGKDR
jgi:glucose/arabinose dehydrogenase/mono/diheme cytochrome c family protein